ncbi:MAG: HPr family phosphocarrier protein [Spirochaetia bacterium]|nr:HPr family phosphocarrier protein [Spirochaetia bacterium]
MTVRNVVVLNRAGIHARPATMIVDTANRFKSQIFLKKDDLQINARSIMIILTLGATYKTPLQIIAEGEDEEAAADAMTALFDSKFENHE